MKATVDANLFRLAFGAVSTEETSYYLNGVNIEPHPVAGALMVSTDGHRMIVIHDPLGSCDEKMIVKLPRFALAQCTAPKFFKSKRQLVVDGKSATINEVTPGINKDAEPKIDAVVTVHNVIIDGTYPDWRRVVPQEEAKPTAAAPTAFNPKYLKAWGVFGEEIAKTTGASPTCQIRMSDGGSPVIVRWAGAENIFAVQMPMRADKLSLLPAFMSVPEFRQAAE